MPRPRNVQGAAKKVRLIDDLGSAVVHEVVEQLNQSEISVSITLSAPQGQVSRGVLGRWRHDAFVKDISVTNAQTDDFSGAATEIALRHVAPTDADLAGAPANATTLLALSGFNGNVFAGPNSLWEEEFVAGTNVTARTGGSSKKVKAGDLLYAEFSNGELGPRVVEVTLTLALIDELALQPNGMGNKWHQRVRGLGRSNR